jgi:DNA invertase Pin-like site-specific DNA recombinase
MNKTIRGYDSLFISRVLDADLDLNADVIRLASTMFKKQIPITWVASMFHVSRGTIYNWITGKSTPQPRYLAMMPTIITKLKSQ